MPFRKSDDFGKNPVKALGAKFCAGARLYNNNNKRVRMIANLSPDCNDHNVCQWKQKLNRESFVNRIAEPVIRFHPGIIADSFMNSHP